ncbi:hypothetical protein MMC28_011506, partial [Mycoblastus sanguinarius]|nr:hypothetical protein [Mycoblastus sanguinarius]
MAPYLFCLLCVWLVPSKARQIPMNTPASSPFTSIFDQLVTENLDRWHTPGLAVAVIDGDETFSKGYGIATFPDEPFTPSTLFYTASTTKSFTAAAVSLLIDDSANTSEPLFWQTPLTKLMREDFVLPDEYATLHASVEDALAHRTGMPRHDLSYGDPNTTVRDVVRNLRHLPMTAEIRTKWQYCNMMYITVSHFIETWTGMWLGDFLRTRIYEPLGMNSTFFSLLDAQAAVSSGKASLATGYYWANYSQTYGDVPGLDAPQESGCGATISNVLDYAKWLRCHMTLSAPLSLAGHRAVRSPRMVSGPVMDGTTGFRGSDAYAFGWEVSNYRGEVMNWHTGGLPGFVSIMLYFPRLQWGLTMMANNGDGSALQVLSFKLIDDKLGIPDEERFDWNLTLELNHLLVLENLRNGEDILYPNAPKGKHAVPLSLPLESYAGTYKNAGYPSLTLTVNSSAYSLTGYESKSTLQCALQYEQWPIYISFQHISGEFFMVYVRAFSSRTRQAPDDYDPSTDSVSKAQFILGEDGKVEGLGVQLDGEMGEAKIWFKKAMKENSDGYGKGFIAGSSTVETEIRPGSSGVGGQKLLFSRLGKPIASLFA